MDLLVTFLTDIDAFLAVIAGGLIAILVSRRYYIYAAKDLEHTAQSLKTESEQLFRQINIVLRALEETGSVALVRDPSQNIIGVVREAALEESVATSASISATP